MAGACAGRRVTTPVTIRLELPGINEDGTPREGRVIEAMGNYAEANKWIMDAERRLIRLQAAVLLNRGHRPGAGDAVRHGDRRRQRHAAGDPVRRPRPQPGRDGQLYQTGADVMGITITLDPRALQDLEAAALRSAELTMEALRTDVVSAQVMPYNVGTMQNVDTFTDTWQSGDVVHAALVTGSPQARRLYFHPEYNFQKANNPPCRRRMAGAVD